MVELLDRRQLLALLEQRAAVLDRADNPFASAAWVSHFLTEVASDDWRYWACHGPEGALTLLHAAGPGAQDARALNNYYASLFSPFTVGAEQLPKAQAAQWAAELTALRPALHTVDLSPIAQAEAAVVQQAFRDAGWMTRRYSCFGNWYMPCEGLDFDTYMAARPSQTLNTWSRKAKKFKAGSADARLQLVTEPGEVEAAMKAYNAVYAKSWKQPEPYPGFVPGWAAICARRGALRLGLAWAGEVPIAAQFWFLHGRRAYIFKLAYDEAYSKLSAGTVLSAFMFKQALDVDRVVEIDYLTGDDPYKRAWVSHRRERQGVIASNPRTLRGAARGLKELVGAARQRLRRSPEPAAAVAG